MIDARSEIKRVARLASASRECACLKKKNRRTGFAFHERLQPASDETL